MTARTGWFLAAAFVACTGGPGLGDPRSLTPYVRIVASGVEGTMIREAEVAPATVRDSDPTTGWHVPSQVPSFVELDLQPWLGREVPLYDLSLAWTGDVTVLPGFWGEPSLHPDIGDLLADALAKPGVKLCVLRDARLPIGPGAIRTRERLEQIVREGGRMIRVEAEALAALDAMRRLVEAATSGDLSRNGDTVEPKTVREWLARNLPSQVQDLASEILFEEPPVPSDPQKDALLDLISRIKVIAAGEAARETGFTLEQLEAYARAYPLHLRWFGGSCPVLCQAVAQTPVGDPNDAR